MGSIISCILLSPMIKYNSYDELITARIEKWATPTFLLVIGVTEQLA